MKKAAVAVMLVAAMLMIGTAAFAAEMSGTVSAVDVEKGMMKLSTGTVDVGFDCEKGSLISNVKVGDQVKVTYEEKGGKKMVSDVTVVPSKRPASVGC
jgi:Cu/Ag efflux protein CusF